jgi:hypothetical protein
MIVVGSTDGKIYCWNLEMMYRYGRCKGKWVGYGGNKYPELEGARGSDDEELSQQTRPKKKFIKKDNLGNLFGLVNPHHTVKVRGAQVIPFRNVMWSLDRRWYVAIGEGL